MMQVMTAGEGCESALGATVLGVLLPIVCNRNVLLPKACIQLPEICKEVLGEQLAVQHVVHSAHLADAVHRQLRHADVNGTCRESVT
jgi:hypothetical protein